MQRALNCLFGVVAQMVAGIILIIVTTVQTVYWLTVSRPTTQAVFIVSMEALYFAAYGIIATALSVLWLNKRTPDA